MEKMYHPKTKEELKALCDDDAINLGDIDISKITDMSELFSYSKRKNFSGIENWDTSKVIDMRLMFRNAIFFNQDISRWNVSNVENMRGMFNYAEAFNQDISGWDVSKVEDMAFMFYDAESFNQPIGNWDVSNVKKMQNMFAWAKAFNQPIGGWDVSNVENMQGMFAEADAFNQPIGNWDVYNVSDMSFMFSHAKSFNQPIGDWDVSNVTTMESMFSEARAFNQPIGSWDVSNVITMKSMFFDAEVFNQPIDDWDVSKVENMKFIFLDADSFNQPLPHYWPVNLSDVAIRMSRENYNLMRLAFDELRTGNVQSPLALNTQALLNADSNNMDYFFRDVNYLLEQNVQIDKTYVDFMFENIRWDENRPVVAFFKAAMKNTDDYDFLRIEKNTYNIESIHNTGSCPFYVTNDGIKFEYKDEQIKSTSKIDCKNAETVFSSIISVFDKAGVKREDLKKAFNAALQKSKKDVLT